MRRCLTHIVFAAAMSLSLPALAQDKNCPPGAWFCAEADVQIPPAPPPPAAKPPPPPAVIDEDDAPPAAPPVVPPVRRQAPPPIVVEAPGPQAAPPPVVIYQPVPAAPPTRVIIVAPGYPYRPYHTVYRTVRTAPPAPPPAVVRPKWHSEWGLNLHVEGLALGHGAAEGSGMGGLGLSLRYRPAPAFAFDLGVDVLTGTDYNGFDRTETPVSLNGMLFVNPKSHVQLYFIAGASYSHAKVKSQTASPLLTTRNEEGDFAADYSYLGGQGGAGLEFRFSRHLALNIDGLGFVRHRTDDGPTPEFFDPKTGQTTKNSGGGLFRGGLSFWW